MPNEQYRLFKQGDRWPIESVSARNAEYSRLRGIYDGSGQEAWKGELQIQTHWRFVPSDLPRIIVGAIRDWLFKSPIKIEWPEDTPEETMQAVDRIVRETSLLSSLRTAKEEGSITGDIYMRLGFDVENEASTEYGVLIDFPNPSMIVPEFWEGTQVMVKSLSVISIRQYETPSGNTKYLYVETYSPGEISGEKFLLDEGNTIVSKEEITPEDPIEEHVATGTESSLIFHIQNRPANKFYGVSDVEVIESPTKQIANRITRKQRVIDFNSAPKLVIPESAMKKREDPETGNVWYEIPTEVIPLDTTEHSADSVRWLTLALDTESIEADVELFTSIAYHLAGVSPLAIGEDTEGGVRSGHALEVEMTPMLTLTESIAANFENVLEKVLFAAQELENYMGDAAYPPIKPTVALDVSVPISLKDRMEIAGALVGKIPDADWLKILFPDATDAAIQKKIAELPKATAGQSRADRLRARIEGRAQETQQPEAAAVGA